MRFWKWASWQQFVKWLHDEVRETGSNLMRDLRSLRALWNYVYLALYAFLCVWGALYHAKDSLNTAIMTTGGIVSAIFAGYVWSTTREKEIGVKPIYTAPKPEKPTEDEEGASD